MTDRAIPCAPARLFTRASMTIARELSATIPPHRPPASARNECISMVHPLMIEARGLVKSFGSAPAVAGLDLSVPAGTTTCLVGPNGAGKTTAVRMLATLVRPDAGCARVAGHDVVSESAAVRRRIGLSGQYASLDECL